MGLFKKSNKLISAIKELAFQNEEWVKRAVELDLANKELVCQNAEKEKRAQELLLANKELLFQNREKEKCAAELHILNKELQIQNELLAFEKSDKEALINNTDDMIWSVDSDFRLIAVNKSYVQCMEKLTGKAVNAGDNVMMPGFFPKEVMDFWNATYTRALSGEIFKEEVYVPAGNNLPQSWRDTSFNPLYKDGDVVGCACYSRNITESKLAGEKIRESEIRLAQAQAVAKVGSWETDLSTLEVIWSAETRRIFGVSDDGINTSHQKFLQFVHPDDKEKVDAAFAASLEKKTANTIEHRIITPDGIIKIVEERWHIINNDNQKTIRAVGTVQDITERKEADKLRNESEAKFRAFFENSIDGILLTVTDGDILAANPAACEIFKMTEEEICAAGRYGVIDTSDPRVEALITERRLTGRAKGELTYKRKDGSTFPGEITSVLFKDSYGLERTSMIIRDITVRKEVEEKLSATSRDLQNALNDLNRIMDSSLDVICAVSEEGYFLKVSAASEAVWGYKPEELIGKPLIDFVYQDDNEKTQTTASRVMAGNNINHFENRYIRKDGSVVPIEWTARWDEKDKIRYGVARDATQKKKLEKAFKRERFRLNDLFMQAPTSMGILKDPNHVFEIANPLYLDLIGKKDIIGKPLCEVLPEIVEQGFIKILDHVYKTGESFSANEMLIKIDLKGTGELIDKYLNFIYQAYKDVHGNVEGIFFFAVDVTEQVLSRNKIEASERRYRNLFEQNLAGVYQSSITGAIINCNNAFAKMLKYDSSDELMNLNASELYFSTEMRSDFIAEVVNQKKLYNYECVLKCKDGSELYAIENISLRKDIISGQEFFDGILIDITDRKKMEETLLQSERRLKEAQATAHVGSWDLNFASGISIWSDEACSIYGLSAEDNKHSYKDWLSFIHPDDMDHVRAVTNESQKTFSNIVLNYRIILKDGTVKHIYSISKYEFDESGKPVGLYGVAHNVTEAKAAENEMKKLSMIARETINGVVICDRHENIVWANNAFTKMYGYELKEVIGKNPGKLFRGADTEIEDVEYINEMILKREPFSFEILNYKKNGDKIYIKVQLQFIFDEKGEIEQYFAIETDITRQKELEEKVEQEKINKQKQITSAVYSAQENERSEIGRELHDNVNQLLGAIKLYIDMARKDDIKRDSLLESSSSYTITAIEEIRKLSKTLITPIISDIGLLDAIKDLAEELMHVHPVKIELIANNFCEVALIEKLKLNIFRIIQEQINNILKHAKAKSITINIEDNQGGLLVSVSDDGIGFDTLKRKAGVGLTNIKSRSELFNGIMQITSELGTGTTLSIIFNKRDLISNNYFHQKN